MHLQPRVAGGFARGRTATATVVTKTVFWCSRVGVSRAKGAGNVAVIFGALVGVFDQPNQMGVPVVLP